MWTGARSYLTGTADYMCSSNNYPINLLDMTLMTIYIDVVHIKSKSTFDI